MITIGIDPGLTGAMAMLGHRSEYLHLEDVPIMQRHAKPEKYGIANQVNYHAAREIIRGWIESYDRAEIWAVIETPFTGGQARQVIASQYLSAGLLEAVLYSLQLTVDLVQPKQWKEALNLTSSKEQARASAIRRWPDAAHLLSQVKDHNRAEALLLARYGQEVHA